MEKGFSVKTYYGSFEERNNSILVDNNNIYNSVKNWHYRLDDAYKEKKDGFSVGVWKIKNK